MRKNVSFCAGAGYKKKKILTKFSAISSKSYLSTEIWSDFYIRFWPSGREKTSFFGKLKKKRAKHRKKLTMNSQ